MRWLRARLQDTRRSWTRGVQTPQRGQAVVEAAGAVMLLLVLVIGIVDFTPAIVRAAQLTQAARDGAAFARSAPTSTFDIRKRVVNSAPASWGTMTDAQIAALTNADIEITCATGLAGAAKACASAVVGDAVTVTVRWQYSPVTTLFSQMLGAPIIITRSATSEIF